MATNFIPNQNQLFSESVIHSDDYMNADNYDETETDFDYIILAKNAAEFEKMKATIDKYMFLAKEQKLNEFAANRITATIFMKKDIELDGRTLYAGQRGFLINGEGMNGQIKMSKLFRDSWKYILPEDKAILQSYIHAYKVQDIVLQNGLADSMYDILDEIEVDRHYHIANAIKNKLLNHPMTEEEKAIYQLYDNAAAYLDALKEPDNQKNMENLLTSFSLSTQESNILSPQEENQIRKQFIESQEKIHINTQQIGGDSLSVSRVSLASKLNIDPNDSSAILAFEPFTAAQAKPFIRAGLPFFHVGLVKNGIEIPYTTDSIDSNASVCLVPTDIDTIDQDLSMYKNDYFVIDPAKMTAKEVHTMKFLFNAIENWKEIDLPDSFVTTLLQDYANSPEALSLDDIVQLREICFTPKIMAEVAVNHNYTMPQLVEILYPANTRLAVQKGERIDQQIQLTRQTENITDFSKQVDGTLAGTTSRYNDIKVCDTPPILLDAGCEQLPMLYSQRHLRKAVRSYNDKTHDHGLSVDQIKKLPELISEPVMIFDSATRNDSIVAVTSETDANGNPIIISIHPNGIGTYELAQINSNYITSVYGKNNFSSFIDHVLEDQRMLYCNEEKSQELFSVLQLQLPQGFNNLNFNTIIRQSKNIVKETEAILWEASQEAASTKESDIKADESKTLLEEQMTELLQFHKEHLSSLLQNSKPTVIINAYAGAGAGKTTSCMDICAGLKKAGYSAEYIQEYAKELVYDGSDLLDGTAIHQYEILKEQLKRQDRFIGQVDFVVTDSPILLNRMYNKELTPEYSEMLKQLHDQYETAGAKNFNFFVNRDMNPNHYEKEGRLQTFEESKKIDQEVKNMLRENVGFFGNYGHDTVNKVITNAIRTRERHIASQAGKENTIPPKKGQSIPRKHFYTKEESKVMIQYLKETISIADIISQYEPLVRSGSSYLKGANHDSLIVDIRQGKNCFHWNSIAAKGSVVDALTTLGNMSNSEALRYLYDMAGGQEAVYEACFGTQHTNTSHQSRKIAYTPSIPLLSADTPNPDSSGVQLPPKSNTNKNVFAYLNQTRKIHKDIINEFIDRNMLYQDDHNNCCFVAYNKEGTANFAIKRGTNTYRKFIGDCKGNDYNYGFYVDNGASELFVGEGVIDIMSKMSLLAEKGIDHHKYNYLAMGGTQKQEPLENIMATYPENKKIILGLDNDKGGMEAIQQIKDLFEAVGIEYAIDMPFDAGKDWNDYLRDYIAGKQQSDPKQGINQKPNKNYEKPNQATLFDENRQSNPIKASARTNHTQPTLSNEIEFSQ